MTQNTSSAVMAQRREPPDALDYFPTPPWATRALLAWLGERADLREARAWEPACGEGHMVRPLREAFAHVVASDAFDYGCGFPVRDFLFADARDGADWIITNPPFVLAGRFAEIATRIATCGVALLVRTAFLEGVKRYETLFRPHPPSAILQFTERVPMHKGRLVADGSTATAYCWLVWRAPYHEAAPAFHWLPPCRRRLERPGDYDPPLLGSAA